MKNQRSDSSFEEKIYQSSMFTKRVSNIRSVLLESHRMYSQSVTVNKTFDSMTRDETSFTTDLSITIRIPDDQFDANQVLDRYVETYKSRFQQRTFEEIASSYCESSGELRMPVGEKDLLDVRSKASIRDYQDVCKAGLIASWEKNSIISIGLVIISTGFLGMWLNYSSKQRARNNLLKENCFHNALIKNRDSERGATRYWLYFFAGISSFFLILDAIIGKNDSFKNTMVGGAPLHILQDTIKDSEFSFKWNWTKE